MVKIVNIFKAAGLWVGTVFLLYGNRSVASSTARGYEGHSAYAPSRSVEVGGKYVASRSLTGPPTYMSPLEIKIGGQLMYHDRRLVFQLAEILVTREMPGGIMERNGRLRLAPG